MSLKTPSTLFFIAATFAVAILLFQDGECAPSSETNIEVYGMVRGGHVCSYLANSAGQALQHFKGKREL